MKRTLRQLVPLRTALLVAGFLSAGGAGCALTAGTVAGVVRDPGGTPQMGIVVELLRADSTLASRVYTDGKGSYSMAMVLPGEYALKAMGGSFVPMLKRNLRIRANATTVVNLTLNTLYDLMQWAPQPARRGAEGADDWAWTLRSAESRPLLRWQQDGSPILVSDARQDAPESRRPESRAAQSRRRVKVSAGAGTARFGAGAKQLAIAFEQDRPSQRRNVLSAQIDPETAGMMNALLGFGQQLANSGFGSRSIQTLAAVAIDPLASSGGRQGLEAVALRGWESLEVMDDLEAEAGSEQVLARAGDGGGASTVFAALPYARLTVHRGDSSFEYRVATAATADPEASEAMAAAWLPVLSARAGELMLEHGLHQELGWSTSAGPADMQLVIFADRVENPVIEASGRLNPSDQAQQWLLVDGSSGLLRAAGPNYSATGMLASVESRLPGHNRVKLSYASGDALVMQASGKPQDVAAMLAGAHARRAQMYSVVLSGAAEGLGTRWRASYRWQPDATVTQVAPYAIDASEPYLNVYIRQPIHWISINREGPGGLEAQLDLRNLLAEGYQPFLTSDGSHLYFAQTQRSIRGGLAFNF